MTPEQVRHSGNHFPTYGECFARNGKDFSAAARDWVDARIPTSGLPSEDSSVHEQMQKWAVDAVGRYDERILSDHFEIFAKGIDRASLVIFWSEGDIDAQKSKLAVVKGSLRDTGRLHQSVDLVGRQKLSLVDAAMKHVHRVESQQRGKGLLQQSEQIPVVLIEDKISNMMAFMMQYADEGNISPAYDQSETIDGDTSADFLFREELLDEKEFDFEQKLSTWKDFVNRHASEFNQFRFIYVAPDKPAAELSPIRRERVQQIIRITNELLSQKGFGDDHFLQMNGMPEKILDEAMCSHSVVISDVDGPLVSQQRILVSREAMIRRVMAEYIDELFDRYYGMTALQFLYFVNQSDLKSVVVAEKIVREGNDRDQPVIMRSYFTGKMTENIPVAEVPQDYNPRMMLEKKPLPDLNSLALCVVPMDINTKNGSFTVVINPKQMGATLENVGCVFPDREIRIGDS